MIINTLIGEFKVTSSIFRKNGNFNEVPSRSGEIAGIKQYSHKAKKFEKTKNTLFVKDGVLLVPTINGISVNKLKNIKW